MSPVATLSASEAFVQRLLTTEDPEKRRALIAHHSLTHEEAHEAVTRLDAEAVRLINVNPRCMEAVSLDGLALAEQAGDRYGWAMLRMRYGESLRAQGNNAGARDCLDEAATVFTRLGYPVEAARTRITWVWCVAALGDLQGAIAAAHKARRVLSAQHQTYRVATLDMMVGNLLLDHGHHAAALRYHTSALRLFRSLGDEGHSYAVRALANRSIALTRLGRHREALADLEVVMDAYRQVGENAGIARNMQRIGENRIALGRYAGALRAFDEARPAMRALGISADAVTLAIRTADCYLALNRPTDALATLAEAEDDLRGIDNVPDALGFAIRRVAAYLLLDHRQEALAILDEAERRYPAGAVHARAWLAVQLAGIELQDGLPEQALATARRAERLARAAGIRRLIADARIIQGTALLVLDDLDRARHAAARARRLAHEIDAAPLLCLAQELLGRVAEARGREGLARRHFIHAITQLERERRGVIFEFRDTFAAARGTAYERLAALDLRSCRPREALAVAERAKSRALVDAITGAIELRPRGTAAARRLARELAAAREDYAAVFASAGRENGHRATEREVDVRRLRDLEARIATLMRQLQLAGAADDIADLYGVATEPALPSLPADTALVEYFFSGDDILRFVVDAGGVRGECLPAAVPEIERLLRSFRVHLDAVERITPEERVRTAAQTNRLLNRLHDRLLGGLNLDVYQSLVIVPHGLLHYLPFHALHDGSRYLVERLAVSYAPSAALYGVCRTRALADRRARSRPLVLAHSAGGQLPFVLDEAVEVGSVLGVPVHAETDATRALLEAEGRRARLIHLAAHGQFRRDAPLFSHIALDDGPLTTADVFNLDLCAWHITLSACETGRSEVGGGDELAGLTRAFLYAGAAGLLVSQWRVDDASTAALMTRFYQGLAEGKGRAEALRAAQCAFVSGEMPQDDRRHPFFWAGFQIIGDNQGMEPRLVQPKGGKG
jgi:CHAT domain-containing protein/tetratricopeptide (TPR) repeat protein